MSRYSKIGVQIWGDERFRRLSRAKPSGRELWWYLLANPARTALSGLLAVGELSLAEGLEWPIAAFRRCWAEIEAQGMARADWRARLVWIPKMVKWDPPNGPNVAKLWGRQIRALPECPLRDEAQSFIDAFLHGISDAIHKAFREGIATPSGMPYRIPPPGPPPGPPPPPVPPTQPSPMPSPPGHGFDENEPGVGTADDPARNEEFRAARAEKVRELTDRFGTPAPPEAIAEYQAWVTKWWAERQPVTVESDDE
jgi:hypothetical protein